MKRKQLYHYAKTKRVVYRRPLLPAQVRFLTNWFIHFNLLFTCNLKTFRSLQYLIFSRYCSNGELCFILWATVRTCIVNTRSWFSTPRLSSKSHKSWMCFGVCIFFDHSILVNSFFYLKQKNNTELARCCSECGVNTMKQTAGNWHGKRPCVKVANKVQVML